MAPTKFLPGDLVLVNFPGDGYWPAEITKILKKSKRKVKCFGEGESGYAFPKDMIYFNYASVENHLSNSSFEKDPARKKALMQISDKYKSKLLKNLEDTKRNLDVETHKRIKLEIAMEKMKSDNKIHEHRCQSDKDIKEIRMKVQADYEEKLQRCSAVYEKKIADLEARVGEERSAAASANQKIKEYKTKLENMTARVASLEALNGTLEQSIKNCNKESKEVSRKRSLGINKSFTGEAKYKRKRLEVMNENSAGSGVDESYSEKDKNKRKRLREGQSTVWPEADESYSEEEQNNRMRLEEGDSSMEIGESHMGEAKNYSKGLEVEESCVNKNRRIAKRRVRVVTLLEEGITPIMDLPIILRNLSHGESRRMEGGVSEAGNISNESSKRKTNKKIGNLDVTNKKQVTQNKRKENNDFVDDELEEIEEIPRCDDENSRNGIQIRVPFFSITVTSQEKP